MISAESKLDVTPEVVASFGVLSLHGLAEDRH